MQRKIVVFMSFIIFWSLFLSPLSFAVKTEKKEIVNDWCLDITNAPRDVIDGACPVKIAVIDSGVSTGNPYIQQGKIATGYNYVFKNTVTNDLIGHGNQAASIIVGASSQKHELISIGSHSIIVPLVWISKYPSGVVVNGGISALCSAIIDAVDVYDCQIINISSGINMDDPKLRAAVAYAEKMGVIIIAAAGNSNQFAPDKKYYPAAYETVVGVGSVNKDKLVSKFSQRNEGVMVTAPGERIYSLSADKSKEFVQVSGTSYSAAYVSGFASLLLSKNSEMSPTQFRKILQDSSQDLGVEGYDTAYGYGLINVSQGLLLSEKNID